MMQICGLFVACVLVYWPSRFIWGRVSEAKRVLTTSASLLVAGGAVSLGTGANKSLLSQAQSLMSALEDSPKLFSGFFSHSHVWRIA
jgi:hypothetical protein